jgi:hypothetical protein
MMDDHLVRYVSGRWAYAPEYRKMFKNWQLDGWFASLQRWNPANNGLTSIRPTRIYQWGYAYHR